MNLTDKDFSKETFAFTDTNDADFPKEFQLSYKQIASVQRDYVELQQKLKDKPDVYQTEAYSHSDHSYDPITQNGKTVIPPTLQKAATEWYHLYLLHPGVEC